MILLLSGKAGVGKDTFADYLVSHHNFTKLAFAKTMKDMSAQMYNIPRNYFDDRDKKDSIIKSLNKTPRDILIEISAKMRAQDPQFWIKQIANKVQKGNNYAISDCRFFTEIEYFKKLFPDETKSIWIEREVKNVVDNTEIGPKDCDFVIMNDKTPFDGNYLWNQLCKKLQKN
jgi:dephospho-CoA kinase